MNEIAHEIWSAAQLLPDDGIEDAVDRIISILNENRIELKMSQLPRYRPDFIGVRDDTAGRGLIYKTIEEIAEEYATIFIVEATKFTLGGKEHKHLVRLLKEFADEINKEVNDG